MSQQSVQKGNSATNSYFMKTKNKGMVQVCEKFSRAYLGYQHFVFRKSVRLYSEVDAIARLQFCKKGKCKGFY